MQRVGSQDMREWETALRVCDAPHECTTSLAKSIHKSMPKKVRVFLCFLGPCARAAIALRVNGGDAIGIRHPQCPDDQVTKRCFEEELLATYFLKCRIIVVV